MAKHLSLVNTFTAFMVAELIPMRRFVVEAVRLMILAGLLFFHPTDLDIS